jgi:hypothetical protein
MAKIKKAQNGKKTDANTTIQKGKLDAKYNKIYRTMQNDSIKESNEVVVPAVYNKFRRDTGKSPSAENLRSETNRINKLVVKDSKANKGNTKLDARGRTENAMNRYKKGGPVKKTMRNGGSLTGLKASNKRVGPVDPNGAFTKVQKKTLAGAKGKASLTKDKQLGATKMTAKCGAKMSKK